MVSDEVLNYYREKGKAGIKKEEDWNELYKKYKEEYPKEAAEYELLSAGKPPAGGKKITFIRQMRRVWPQEKHPEWF